MTDHDLQEKKDALAATEVDRDEKGGAEFMSYRHNVRKKRRLIRRDLSPLQNYLLDDILEGTVNEWDSKNEFDLKELANGLGIKVNRIYVMLKDLAGKSIIIRQPTRYAGREILGLNPDFFGQILTDHQHGLEQKRHLSLVPNGTNLVPNGTNQIQIGTNPVQKRYQLGTERDKLAQQLSETINESVPLDLIDPIDSIDSLRVESKADRDTHVSLERDRGQRFDKRDWLQVRSYLQTAHPCESERIDFVYKHFNNCKIDLKGNVIENLSALMFASYPSLRDAITTTQDKPFKPMTRVAEQEKAFTTPPLESMSKWFKTMIPLKR